MTFPWSGNRTRLFNSDLFKANSPVLPSKVSERHYPPGCKDTHRDRY